MNTSACEKAKQICCNVDVWGILINIILQVSFNPELVHNKTCLFRSGSFAIYVYGKYIVKKSGWYSLQLCYIISKL